MIIYCKPDVNPEIIKKRSDIQTFPRDINELVTAND